MNRLRRTLSASLLLALSACAALSPPALTIGEPEASVIAKLGRPSASIPDGNDHLLEYGRNPWGQTT